VDEGVDEGWVGRAARSCARGEGARRGKGVPGPRGADWWAAAVSVQRSQQRRLLGRRGSAPRLARDCGSCDAAVRFMLRSPWQDAIRLRAGFHRRRCDCRQHCCASFPLRRCPGPLLLRTGHRSARVCHTIKNLHSVAFSGCDSPRRGWLARGAKQTSYPDLTGRWKLLEKAPAELV
jgi:hypothetical protein